jgi:hypothetical protein
MISKTLRTWLPDNCQSRKSAPAGTSFSPLPCHAWHIYMVTNAHRLAVHVDADGHGSAPTSRAAAVAPPTGAWDNQTLPNLLIDSASAAACMWGVGAHTNGVRCVGTGESRHGSP